jgi:hypothetical protein
MTLEIRNMKQVIICCLFAISLVSCSNHQGSDPEETQADSNDKRIHDSLSAAGQHGYYVTFYIVGRLKTKRIEDVPVDITILKMAPEMMEEKIAFHFLDSIHYEIAFLKNEKETHVEGLFDKKTEDLDVSLVISKKESLSNSLQPEVYSSIKNIDYVFKVHDY